MRTRIKICGIKSVEIALHAATAGADAIGLMFYPESSRCVGADLASRISRSLPPFVSRVGVFANQEREAIQDIIGQVPLDLLQFHGDESPAFCAAFDIAYIKVIRVGPETDIAAICSRYPDAAGIMLDSLVKGALGGTGEKFDWSSASGLKGGRIILAGGLNPGNVGEAIRQIRPWSVDVSSGVESDGEKDPHKITEFCHNVLSLQVT